MTYPTIRHHRENRSMFISFGNEHVRTQERKITSKTTRELYLNIISLMTLEVIDRYKYTHITTNI